MYIIYCNSFVIYYILYIVLLIYKYFFICRHLLPVGQYGVGSGYVLGGIALLAPLRAYACGSAAMCSEASLCSPPCAHTPRYFFDLSSMQ